MNKPTKHTNPDKNLEKSCSVF